MRGLNAHKEMPVQHATLPTTPSDSVLVVVEPPRREDTCDRCGPSTVAFWRFAFIAGDLDLCQHHARMHARQLMTECIGWNFAQSV